MAGRQPLILILLNWLSAFIQYVFRLFCRLLALPILLFISFTSDFIELQAQPLTFASIVSIPFRWGLASSFVPSVLYFYYKLVGCILQIFSSPLEERVLESSLMHTCIISFLYLFIAFCMAEGFSDLRSSFQTIEFNKYLLNILDAQVLMCGFIAFILTLFGILRFNILFPQCLQSKSAFISTSLTQLLFTLIDWLTMPFEIFIQIFRWRNIPAMRQNALAYHEQLGITILGSLDTFIDIIFFVLVTPVFVTIYRCPGFLHKCRGESFDDIRIICFLELLELFNDFIHICISLFSFHRFPLLIINVYHCPDTQSKRFCVRNSIKLATLDILSLTLVLLIAVPTIYRLPRVCRALSTSNVPHAKINHECFTVLSELPAWIALFILCSLFPYRLFFFIQNFFTTPLDDKANLVIVEFTDALSDIPYNIAFFMISFTWRGPFMLMNLLEAEKCKESLRKEILKQLYFVLDDIPALICFIFLLLSVYRLPYVSFGEFHRSVFHQFKQLLCDLPYIVMFLESHLFFWRVPLMWKRIRICPQAATRRCIVKWTLTQGINDLPFIVLFLLSHIFVWRLHTMYHQLFISTTDPSTRRNITVEAFSVGVLDVPHIFLFILAHVFPWRIVSLWTECLRHNSAAERYSIIQSTFIQGLIDSPYVFCFLSSLLMVWRAREAFNSVITNDIPVQGRRDHALRVFLLGLKDIPCGLMVVFLFLTQWRWHRFKNMDIEWHTAATKQFLLLMNPFDFICIFIAPMSLWRFPSMLSCLNNPVRVRNDQDRRMVGNHTSFKIEVK